MSTVSFLASRSHRLVRSRTPGFHPGNRGSNPLGIINWEISTVIQLLPLVLFSTALEVQTIDFAAATSLSFERQTQALIQPDGVEEEKSMTVSTLTWGRKDTWRWNIQGGYAKDVKDSDNTLTTYGVEFEYFIEDALSLDLGFFGMDIDQEGPSTDGFNLTLQLRWHFHNEESWSMFMEGGAGLLRASNVVPVGGSSFNFTPQAGLGLSFDIGNNNRWLLGVKWHHISNANMYSSNPGRDSIMVWTGISFPY